MSEKNQHIHPAYRPDIDGLRAIAVLAVVAFHAAPKRIPGGFVGVDVFFVISGFLISSLLISALNKGVFSYSDFYVRRIRRIFPALILMFAFVLVTGWFLLLPDEYKELGKHVVAGSLFTSNFALWSEAGYFDVASVKKPLLHLWSLGIEEQFYIAWPLLLALLWRRDGGRIRWVVAGAATSLLICWILAWREPTAAFFLPFARFWQLLAGAMLAMAAVHFASTAQLPCNGESKLEHALQFSWVRNLCAWVGISLVVGAIFLVDEQSSFPWLRAVVPTLGTTMIIAAGPQSHINRYVLSNRAMVFVGLISYPLYLWHWPLLSMLEIVQPPGPTRIYKLAAVAIAFVLATMTYVYIEKRVRTPPYVRLRWLIAGAVVCLVAGVALVASEGFSAARGPWGIRSMPDRFETAQMQTAACVEEYGSAFQPRLIHERDFCIKEHVGESDVLVLGDSHANRLFFGLRDTDPARTYLNLGRSTCIPLLGFDASWADTGEQLICRETLQGILQRAIRDRMRTVVLHGFFVRAFNGSLQLSGMDSIAEEARTTLELLSKAGIRTIVVLDVPVLPFEPSTCVLRPALKRLVTTPCEFSRRDWQQQSESTNAALRRAGVGLSNVSFFDPATVLCDERACYAERHGELLYLDTHHLSKAGVTLVGAKLAQQIGLP